MENRLSIKNITFYSLELNWKGKKVEDNFDSYEYQLYQKEGDDNTIGNLLWFKEIYKGKNLNFEVKGLKSNQTYTFKLKVMREGNLVSEEIKTIKTKIKAILPNIYCGEKNDESKNKLSDFQAKIIKNCCALIFAKKNDNIIEGNFDNIEIKITQENDIYYISFDINPDYFKTFFIKFVEERVKNVILPGYFLINNLPTILILNFLEKGPVILTGKRMGGVIASSLVFYILYAGRLYNKEINYGNPFLKMEKNCIGAVTFGSPSFLHNIDIGIKMEEFAPYFYNIKDSFDFIPMIIDFINKKKNIDDLLNILQKDEFSVKDISILNDYLENNLNIQKRENLVDKIINIPFGYYCKMKKSDFSFIFETENNFRKYYYFQNYNANNSITDLRIYNSIPLKNEFNKEFLQFLEKKDYELESIRIIRRQNLDGNSMKGIIKFQLNNHGHNVIAPDIINKIKLRSLNEKYEIQSKDIYYDNNYNITAYKDNLNDNINEVIIIISFGGEIKVKDIINIQGSGQTRQMVKETIEKLFFIPYFKLFEIFYNSLDVKMSYEKLKQENFGNNFEDIKILKPFEKQIQLLNNLLYISRPDVLGAFEDTFLGFYIEKNWNEKQTKCLSDNLKEFYRQGIKLQNEKRINCLDSKDFSIAESVGFPQNKFFNETKKLFFCEDTFFESDDFYRKKLDNNYIKQFHIKNLIKSVLKNVEISLKDKLNKLDKKTFKQDLKNNIGKLYNEQILPNAYFILTLILSSIESSDEIKYNHELDFKKINNFIKIPFIWVMFIGEKRAKYEKDFKKLYLSKDIEELNIINLFNKIKAKSIINSNILPNNTNSNDNKIYNLSRFSETKKGQQYYFLFLQLLNNYSNEFQEDIELSIYNNLKENNKNSINFYATIKELMNNLINDAESKKCFLALVRQSYLLGELRTNIVSI